MAGFIVQRVLQAVLVVFVISALVFIGVYAVGNPIDVLISPDATQDIRAATIRTYGLDRPLYEQYFTFVGGMLNGNFGRSFVFGLPVLQLIMSRLPATLELALAAVLGATLLGVPLGIYAGMRPRSALAKFIMAFSVIGFSVPTFWIGLLLIFGFSVHFHLLPAGGRGETVEVFGVALELPYARRAEAPAVAGAQSVAVQVRHDGAPCARGHARGHVDRDGEVRARHGVARAHHPAASRAEADRDPDRDGVRPRIRLDARLRGGDRDDLLLARHRQADHRLDHLARPARDGRLPDPRRVAVRADQPRGRSGLRAARSASAPRAGSA